MSMPVLFFYLYAGAAIAAMGVSDTVKQAGERNADGSRLVRGTIPRDAVFLAQTPQAFRGADIAEAHAAWPVDQEATDDAQMVRALGKTCLFITHRIDDAIEMANRVIVLTSPARISLELTLDAEKRARPEMLRAQIADAMV